MLLLCPRLLSAASPPRCCSARASLTVGITCRHDGVPFDLFDPVDNSSPPSSLSTASASCCRCCVVPLLSCLSNAPGAFVVLKPQSANVICCRFRFTFFVSWLPASLTSVPIGIVDDSTSTSNPSSELGGLPPAHVASDVNPPSAAHCSLSTTSPLCASLATIILRRCVGALECGLDEPCSAECPAAAAPFSDVSITSCWSDCCSAGGGFDNSTQESSSQGCTLRRKPWPSLTSPCELDLTSLLKVGSPIPGEGCEAFDDVLRSMVPRSCLVDRALLPPSEFR